MHSSLWIYFWLFDMVENFNDKMWDLNYFVFLLKLFFDIVPIGVSEVSIPRTH